MVRLKLFVFAFVIALGTFVLKAQSTTETPKKINWISFKEAVELNKKGNKRKIVTDVFTSWCGWCKRMDNSTFANPEIVDYVDKYFWAVKLDAEMKDTVVIDGIAYLNKHPNANRSSHELAIKLLQNQMSYPSYVFSNEENQTITVVPGYLNAENFMLVLRFFNENIYLTKPFSQFKAENAPNVIPQIQK